MNDPHAARTRGTNFQNSAGSSHGFETQVESQFTREGIDPNQFGNPPLGGVGNPAGAGGASGTPTPVQPPRPRSAPAKTQIISREPKPAPAWLVETKSNAKHELHGEKVFVGRTVEPGNVLLTDDTVSGRHAVILCSKDSYMVQDTGSRNGTYLNGQRTQGRQQLQDGDRIRFGEVELIFKRI